MAKQINSKLDYELNEELRVYAGQNYVINDKVILKQPTLKEIAKFGEHKYLSAITCLVMTSSDMIAELADMGIDWQEIDDMSAFMMTTNSISDDVCDFLFEDLRFSNFERIVDLNYGGLVLFDKKNNTKIDKSIQRLISSYFRDLFGFKYNKAIAGTETTKNFMIEDAQSERRKSKRNKPKSFFKPLISAMVNKADFKLNYNEVWDMKINAFMDSVKRVQLIYNCEKITTGIYSGSLDAKSIKTKELDWIRDI